MTARKGVLARAVRPRARSDVVIFVDREGCRTFESDERVDLGGLDFRGAVEGVLWAGGRHVVAYAVWIMARGTRSVKRVGIGEATRVGKRIV